MRLAFTSLIFLALAAGFAHGQVTPAQRGFQPVEQRVEDLDPLARSSRQINQGLGYEGRESYVYRRPGDSQRLYYMRPGITASYDSRSEYMRLYDRYDRTLQILQMIPANTVFHITPPAAEPETPEVRPDPPQLIDGRVAPPLVQPGAAAGQAWVEPLRQRVDVATVRRMQTESVLKAIDRVTAPAAEAVK